MEGAGADFFQREAGGEGFGFGDGSAGDAAEEEIQETLTGGGGGENVSEEGGLGRFSVDFASGASVFIHSFQFAFKIVLFESMATL